MLARRGSKLEAALAVELPQTQPVLLVHFSRPQRDALGAVDLLEPGRLLGHDDRVVLEHVHDKVVQGGNVLGVRLVLEDALVVDVGQEVGVLEVLVELLGVAEVLGGHQVRLDVLGKGVAVQQGHGALAQPVGGAAGAVVDDAVVLRSERDEVPDGREVAPLDVSPQELAALGEANGVDGRRRAQDLVARQLVAHLVHLLRHVAPPRRRLVARGVVGELDIVHQGTLVELFDQVSDGLDAFVGEIIS